MKDNEDRRREAAEKVKPPIVDNDYPIYILIHWTYPGFEFTGLETSEETAKRLADLRITQCQDCKVGEHSVYVFKLPKEIYSGERR